MSSSSSSGVEKEENSKFLNRTQVTEYLLGSTINSVSSSARKWQLGSIFRTRNDSVAGMCLVVPSYHETLAAFVATHYIVQVEWNFLSAVDAVEFELVEETKLETSF